MMNRLFLLPLSLTSLLFLSQPVIAQDKATPTPSPTPVASPAPVSAAKAADAPATTGGQPPSPVTQTTAESEAAANVVDPLPSASPLASPAPTPAASPASKDADFLPEPTDASLGAPVEPAPDALPSDNDAAPSDLPNPDNLIPQGTSSSADNAPPEPPKVVENKFDKERKLQVRYQEVKLQVLKDAGVRSLNAQADAAKTDEAKRQALREYYRLLFAKMTAIDAELKVKCDLMEQAYLRRLGQYRVSPTIPLNPPPTPEPLSN